MSLIITYLFFGVLWNIILDFITTIMESENGLNNKEKAFSILIWPISLIIFGYHFIKGLIR